MSDCLELACSFGRGRKKIAVAFQVVALFGYCAIAAIPSRFI